MKSVILVSPRRIELADVPKPDLPEDGLLLRTIAASLCSTDVAYYKGVLTPPSYPVVLGHEYLGKVEALGPRATEGNIGDQVVYFGDTDFGGFAEYRAIRAADTPATDGDIYFTDRYFMDDRRAASITLPVDLDLPHASIIEPVTAVMRALLFNPPTPGSNALVLGSGPCGFIAGSLLTKFFACLGVDVLERDPVRRELALANFADNAIEAESPPSLSAAHEKYDYVFDTLPQQTNSDKFQARRLAMMMARPRARYVVYGASEAEQMLDMWLVLSKGVTIMSAPFDVRAFPMHHTTAVMRVAARLVSRDFIDVAPLISQTIDGWDIDAVENAIENYGVDGNMKTILRFG